MNRTIKFRGMAEGKNGFNFVRRWVYGSLLWWAGDHQIWTEDGSNFVVIPETVGQFTGLYDKNGTEIYEGDIVRSENHLPKDYSVEFIEGGFCCNGNGLCIPIDINHFYPSVGCEIEVIGNIHDNKELLT